jgi:hypothetical protein
MGMASRDSNVVNSDLVQPEVTVKPSGGPDEQGITGSTAGTGQYAEPRSIAFWTMRQSVANGLFPNPKAS